ncbi:MAG: hypothetical protein WD270_06210 [Acetobacterales bacterium]
MATQKSRSGQTEKTAGAAAASEKTANGQAAELPSKQQSDDGGGAEFLARTAVPVALVATGLGILATKSINGGDNKLSRAAERGQARATAAAVEWGERGRELSQELKEEIVEELRRSGQLVRRNLDSGVSRSQEMVRENPLATGLAALAIGAGLAALVLPSLTKKAR